MPRKKKEPEVQPTYVDINAPEYHSTVGGIVRNEIVAFFGEPSVDVWNGGTELVKKPLFAAITEVSKAVRDVKCDVKDVKDEQSLVRKQLDATILQSEDNAKVLEPKKKRQEVGKAFWMLWHEVDGTFKVRKRAKFLAILLAALSTLGVIHGWEWIKSFF